VPYVPIAAILSCLWLMLNLPVETWIRFGLWMLAGLVVYFWYGRRHVTRAMDRRDSEAVEEQPVLQEAAVQERVAEDWAIED
jgi:APA family basic amino acid/polyamine antiporter